MNYRVLQDKYPQYLEQWLNDRAKEGYKLVSLDADRYGYGWVVTALENGQEISYKVGAFSLVTEAQNWINQNLDLGYVVDFVSADGLGNAWVIMRKDKPEEYVVYQAQGWGDAQTWINQKQSEGFTFDSAASGYSTLWIFMKK